MIAQSIKNKFVSFFQNDPRIIRSPGRINMIGEHTDYNEGFVMPAAIDKEIVCAINRNKTNSCTLIASDLDETRSGACLSLG